MNLETHKERHNSLHKHLDELVADFLSHTKKNLCETTIMELMTWSCEQTKNPTDLEVEL
jgi:hypothetical protein